MRYLALLFSLIFIPFLVNGWSGPIQISDSGINFNATQAVSALGTVETAWTNGSYPNLSIYTSSYSGGSFSAPTAISGPGICDNPKIGVDDLGNAVLVWSEYVTNGFLIQAATKAVAGSWSSPSAITTTSKKYVPTIAMNGAGNVIAGWIDYETNQVEVAHLTFGGSWSAITVISNLSGAKNDLQIGIDSNGNGYAIWKEESLNEIYASNYGGVTWTVPVSLSSGGINDNPVLAVNPSGGAVAAWINLNINELRASNYSGGSWYDFPIIISNHVRNQAAVSTHNDKTCFAMLDNQTNSLKGVFSISDDWQLPVTTISGSQERRFPTVTIDSANTAFIAWVSVENDIVEVVEWPNGGSPGSATAISDIGIHLLPQGATNGTLTSVIWLTHSGSDVLIYANLD